jgi:hypothetical protein
MSALLRAVAQHVVVGRGEAAVGTPELELAPAQLGVAAFRAVVHQVSVDIEQRVAVVAIDDDVPSPDLLEHRERDHDDLPTPRRL